MVFADLVDDSSNFIKVGIFAAGAFGRIGKHSNFGLCFKICLMGFCGVFNDGVELLGGWLFVDAAVGDSEMRVVFLADKTARKKRGSKRNFGFTGKENVARGEIYTGND